MRPMMNWKPCCRRWSRSKGAVTDINQRIANLSPEKRALLEQHLLKKAAAAHDQPVLEPRHSAEPPPLSFAQQRLWFLHQLEPDSTQFNTARATTIHGELDIEALRRAINRIIERHEAIRTVFTAVVGEPRQCILPEWSFDIPVVDCSAAPSAEKERHIRQAFLAEARRPFDLSHDLMLRVSLLRHSPTEHTLIMVKHHIASDAWSASLFNRELAALYQEYVMGETAVLPSLPVQYADYAIWQRRLLETGALQKQLTYWHNQLAGSPPLLELPTDRPRPAMPSHRGAELVITLPPTLRDAVNALARQSGTTPFIVLLAAFQLLLSRLSGQTDVLVGSPVAGRSRVETEPLVGFFLNNLVLRGDLSGNPTFLQLLARVRQTALAAYANQDVPFEKLVEALQLERDLSRQPLFQVMFIMQNGARPTLELPGLVLTPRPSHNGASLYDFTVAVTELADGLRLQVEYSTDLFDAATIGRWMGHYELLLTAVTTTPAQPIHNLCLLTEAERTQQQAWNNTGHSFPAKLSLLDLLAAQTSKTPDAIAFICGEARLTYVELWRQSNQVAHYLRARGVQPGTAVGLCLHRSLTMIVGLVGILKAGAAWLPLDPAYPAERLALMLADAGVEVVVTQVGLTAVLPTAYCTKAHCLDDPDSELSTFPDSDPGLCLAPDSLAYLIYTSGSTGRPKGVAVPHWQILNRLHWMWQAYPFAPDEVGCQKTALSFVDAIWEIFGPLLQGIPTVILPDGVLKDPPQLVDALSQHGITRLWFVPSFLRVLLETTPDLQVRLPKLNFWVSSGEPIGWELYHAFKAQLPDAEMYNLYGTSEVWDATWYVPDLAHTDQPFVPIGRPIANLQTVIMDQAGQPAPVGVVGELCVGGAGLGWGYLNRPDLTAEKFIPHPLSAAMGARLYRTGDLAYYLPDGQIAFIGRHDHQVKIRGYRIECGEVETALLKLPEVRNAVVVAQERSSSPGENQLVAFVVPEPDAQLDWTALRQQLRTALPEFMVPSVFTVIESLPLTPSGKINRRALPQVDAVVNAPADTVAPRTPLEAQLAALWEDVLQRQPIGVTDNFFDLGGHSLLAVRLFARLNKQFGHNLPLAILFTAPTIAALADVMEAAGGAARWSSLVPMQPVGGKRPFFFVHGGAGQVFHYHELATALGTERPFYAVQPQGWDQHRVAVPTIAELAAAYLDEIRTVQASGPYHLGGYCFGGLIAFEMARQLQLAGETVATLVVVDPSPIKRMPVGPGGSKRAWQRHQHALTQRSPGEKLHYLRTSARHRLQTVVRTARGVMSRAGLGRLGLRLYLVAGRPVPEHWRDFYLMELVSRQAGMAYVPQGKFDGRIHLFVATRAALGWPLAATKGAAIHRLATDHLTILQRPYIQEIAQKIQQHLSETEAGQS